MLQIILSFLKQIGMTIYQRVLAPKPVFFKRVQRGGLLLALLCLGLLLWPYPLTAVLQVSAACGYAAGLTAAIVSQLTTGGKTNKSKTNGRFIARRK
jgi:hypothetical protein